MKHVVKEYASSAAALAATAAFLLVAGTLLFGAEGILARMIALTGGSGIG